MVERSGAIAGACRDWISDLARLDHPLRARVLIAGAGELKQWSISSQNIQSVSAGGDPVDFQPIAEDFRAAASDASIVLVGSIAA